jgi:glycosyltransferase involved in cell wall biosynthesis
MKHRGKDMVLWSGIADTKTEWIGVMDGDGQYYFEDFEKLFEFTVEQNADAVWGIRSNRNDTFFRLASSIAGKWMKKILLGNTIVKDTGCGLFIARTSFLKHITKLCPLPYGQVHCQLPELITMLGGTVVETAIKHRARLCGKAKYGMLNRLLPGLFSLWQTRYLLRHYKKR